MESLLTSPASSRATAPLRAFRELIARLQESYNTKEPAEFLRYLLEESGYMPMLKDRNMPEDVATDGKPGRTGPSRGGEHR